MTMARMTADLPKPATRRAAEARNAKARNAKTRSPRPRAPAIGRSGPLLQTLAALLWLPQAALLAHAVGTLTGGGGVADVLWPAGGILALGLARAGLDALGARLAFRQARAFLSGERRDAVAALAARSPLDAGRPASGLAASVLAEQAEAVVPYLSRFQPARLRATLVPLAILACVFVYSWAVALVLLVAAPLIPVFMALIGWRAKAASEAQLVELGSMNAFLLDRLSGLATLRSFGAVEATAARLAANAESLRRRTMAVLRIAFLSSAVLELFAALGVAMVAVYVGFHLLGQVSIGTWGDRLSLAEGLFVLLLAPAFFEPLRDLSAAWHDRAAGEAALSALRSLKDRGAGIAGTAEDASAGAAGPAGLRIEALTFRHGPEAAPVFADLSLTVKPGEHVALLAPSGGGKSTLLALIAGLARPQGGRILIDGEALGEGNAARLRRRLGWIGQKPHVFAGTLSGNVTLGRRDVAPAVPGALDRAGLGAVAATRGPALIGEGGTGLSGGEASRLALARLAAAPEAGLILADEPTAHLDGATAAAITETLIALAEGRTLIVATHDPALAARMGRTIRLGGAA